MQPRVKVMPRPETPIIISPEKYVPPNSTRRFHRRRMAYALLFIFLLTTTINTEMPQGSAFWHTRQVWVPGSPLGNPRAVEVAPNAGDANSLGDDVEVVHGFLGASQDGALAHLGPTRSQLHQRTQVQLPCSAPDRTPPAASATHFPPAGTASCSCLRRSSGASAGLKASTQSEHKLATKPPKCTYKLTHQR